MVSSKKLKVTFKITQISVDEKRGRLEDNRMQNE